MNILWTARPYTPLHTGGGGAYGEEIFNYIDNYSHIFIDFSHKSKLVAHTSKCSD